MYSLVSRVYKPLSCDSLRLRRCAGSFLCSILETRRRLNYCGGQPTLALNPASDPAVMPPLGPFDEARLFAAFEQSGKRSLDLYNVSFFCGTLDEQGKPHGDIGLDDLIDSEGLRCQKMQEDIIWTGTLAIKKKDQTYKYLLETGRLSLIVEAARRDRANIGFSQWEAGVEIRIKGKYYLHGFRGTSLEAPESHVIDH